MRGLYVQFAAVRVGVRGWARRGVVGATLFRLIDVHSPQTTLKGLTVFPPNIQQKDNKYGYFTS